MKKEYEALFTPWKIGNCEIKNRIVMTSMGGTSIFGWMEPNHFDQEAAKFLMAKAKNNVGLVLPGIAPVKDPMGGKWLYKGTKKFKKLQTFMDEFHETGAKMFVQITAGFGRSMAVNEMMEKMYHNKVLKTLGKPFLDIDWLCQSASATPNRWSDSMYSREMTQTDIDAIIDGFAKTAKYCKDAGVDGVEVHAVHEGYLLDQFAMKYSNQRTDQYGGSLENRLRFAIEIVQAIKKVCGNDFPVSLRYSVVSKTKGFREGALPGEDYVEVGRDMAESKLAAKLLQDAGYDMLNCDNGTYDAWYWAHPPQYMPENCNLEYVEELKNSVDIPLVCAGKMTPAVAAKAIEDGKLDAMGVARQFLVDTEWVTKLMEGREDEIKPCINCHNGCFNMSKYRGTPNIQDMNDAMHMARCALTPETMQSNKYKIVPATKSKKVAIIGGGIGGMEAALVLKKRGHVAEIFEKTDCLGGVFIQAAAPSYKERDKELIEWYRRTIARENITVHFNSAVEDLASLKESFDEIIVATGSKAKKPPIKGIEHTMDATDFLSGKKVGDNIVIIGGGLTGCEIAYELLLQGKHPTIVEMKNDLIAVKGVCLANSSFLRDMFNWKDIPVFLNSQVVEIEPDNVLIQDEHQIIKRLVADDIILSAGYESAPAFAKGSNVHLVGDADKVGNLRTVIWRAWDVAMKI